MKVRRIVEGGSYIDMVNETKCEEIIECDKCHQDITSSNPGIILMGNIYVAEPNFAHTLGGIIGNNFPHWTDKDQPEVTSDTWGKTFKFAFQEIRPNAFHTSCLSEILSEASIKSDCPHNCGGKMVVSEDKESYRCDKCGYDPRMDE